MSEYQRINGLDLTRGIAALGVATFWHYNLIIGGRKFHPLSDIFFFNWLLNDSYLFVDLFFLLSGMIFASVYGARLSAGAVKSRKFWLARFSRLYPLHLLTLLCIATLNIISNLFSVKQFSYCKSDYYHFFLNIFLLQSSPLSKYCSFNSPSWSLSIELYCYIIFFFGCVLFKDKRHIIFLLLSVIGYYLIASYKFNWGFQPNFGRGLFAFFLGTILLYPFLIFEKRLYHISLNKKIILFFAISSILLAILLNRIPSSTLFNYMEKGIYLNFSRMQYRALFYDLLFFPLLILQMATVSTLSSRISSFSKFFGDISYSIYLNHVPLMTLIHLLLYKWKPYYGITRNLYFWIFYTLTLLLISTFIYLKIEKPVMNFLRKKFN